MYDGSPRCRVIGRRLSSAEGLSGRSAVQTRPSGSAADERKKDVAPQLQLIPGGKEHLSSVCFAALWIVDGALLPFVLSVKYETVHYLKAYDRPGSESRIRVVIIKPRLPGAATWIVGWIDG